MNRPTPTAVALIALAALALVLAGCGDTVIDDAKTAEATAASLEKSLHEKIRSVDCPQNVKVETGRAFTCTVDLSTGEEATATLKILNSDADTRIVGLKPTRADAGNENEQERGE